VWLFRFYILVWIEEISRCMNWWTFCQFNLISNSQQLLKSKLRGFWCFLFNSFQCLFYFLLVGFLHWMQKWGYAKKWLLWDVYFLKVWMLKWIQSLFGLIPFCGYVKALNWNFHFVSFSVLSTVQVLIYVHSLAVICNLRFIVNAMHTLVQPSL